MPQETTSSSCSDDLKRVRMVEEQLVARNIRSTRLLEAMREVPRHLFVPREVRARAYADAALSIGQGQTISQPYMVALMLEALELEGSERVLDVGAGSGYQTAILARLAGSVVAVEILPELLETCRANLQRLQCSNVTLVQGDGAQGLAAAAPYDAIAVAAAAEQIPPPLLEQLAEGGRLVMPIGDANDQALVRARKTGGRVETVSIVDCAFVPLVGGPSNPASA